MVEEVVGMEVEDVEKAVGKEEVVGKEEEIVGKVEAEEMVGKVETEEMVGKVEAEEMLGKVEAEEMVGKMGKEEETGNKVEEETGNKVEEEAEMLGKVEEEEGKNEEGKMEEEEDDEMVGKVEDEVLGIEVVRVAIARVTTSVAGGTAIASEGSSDVMDTASSQVMGSHLSQTEAMGSHLSHRSHEKVPLCTISRTTKCGWQTRSLAGGERCQRHGICPSVMHFRMDRWLWMDCLGALMMAQRSSTRSTSPTSMPSRCRARRIGRRTRSHCTAGCS